MNQIFLFTNIDIFHDVISKALKNHQVNTFLIEEDQELDYFIQDMDPQLLVIDWEGFKQRDKLIARLENSEIDLDIVIIAESCELKKYNIIKKPVAPLQLYNQLNSVIQGCH